MDNPKKFPHFRQSDKKRNCGAACMTMLFHHYKMRRKLLEITNQISEITPKGYPSCRNYRIVQYALKSGLNCSAVTAKDPKTFIPYCLESGIDVFILYHKHLPAPYGHFSLVTNLASDGIFINDPELDAPDGINCYMSYDELCNKMEYLGSDDEITRSNVMILFSKKGSGVPVQSVKSRDEYPLFSGTLDKINEFLDPYSDQWISVERLSPTPTAGIVTW